MKIGLSKDTKEIICFCHHEYDNRMSFMSSDIQIEIDDDLAEEYYRIQEEYVEMREELTKLYKKNKSQDYSLN